MTFYFHEDAETEFEKAIEYYEDRLQGLGLGFAEEVYAAIERVTRFPDAWSPISKNTRRCLLNRFPFGIIYQASLDQIHIFQERLGELSEELEILNAEARELEVRISENVAKLLEAQ